MHELPLTTEQVKHVKNSIKQNDHWNEKDYKLEMLAEWDNQRLPIIVAIPTKLKIDYSPRFAILPDGNLITPRDDKAFETIMAAIFQEITPQDANTIAELAIMFSAFEKPVGKIYPNAIDPGRIGEKLKRKEPGAVFKKKGSTITIEFYTHDYELLYFYDCVIAMNNTDIKCSARQLKKK
ncbi:MAG TPA: hypothetical protein VKM55_06755 [Candidatus Lokiarchaeia archaeon]|nr:hypothetical protein [Candidatus Lokiarchaeia archaeon]